MSKDGDLQSREDLADAIERSTGIGLSRRTLLKGAGLGSLVLASVPTLGTALARRAFAAELLNVHLVTVSTDGGQPIGPGRHMLVLAGAGHIHGTNISAGGRFIHLIVPDPVAPPFEVFASGTWRAGEVLGWDPIGSAVGFAAGILDLVTEFMVTQTGDTLSFESKIVCNIPPVGLDTGLREGVHVMGTPVGNFEPLHPELGATAFLTEG